MDRFINELKIKYNYSDELLNFLRKLVPILISYYGEEYQEIILNALSNCEIHIETELEDTKKYLNNYFECEKDWNLPSLAGAFYHNEIKIDNGELKSKPIIYIKRKYLHVFKPFNFNDDKLLNTLIHEICHLIKGFRKVRKEKNNIVDSTGLSKDFYKIDESGQLIEEKSEMLGIEEALNDAETAQILEIMTGRPQQVQAYKAAGSVAVKLLENEELVQIIRKSQFNGDQNWINYIGIEESKILIENLDILVNSLYVSLSDINTAEKRAKLIEKINIAVDNLNNLIEQINNQEKHLR